ncbi:MAG: excinuclease ABC subunit UvrB [Bacteroidaceae bacterium]|nr:excinuclease ABC subunit UvrB [Bacteroidaceae bacterium]
MDFQLTADYRPTGDQPEAIRQLTQGVLDGVPAQVLLGVTGSGKTFTMANVIANVGKPTLILSHNKTLAAQLYGEMKQFFPRNAVEYYVSYYDYYQPEAYIPSTDTYIEKDLAINEEIDKLRLASTSALLSGRKDVIVVSSVSCIYGMGNPTTLSDSSIDLRVGQHIDRNELLRRLLSALYLRNDVSFSRGEVRVIGDTLDIWLAYADTVLRVTFWDDEIESLQELNPESMQRQGTFMDYRIYPANLFMTSQDTQEKAIHQIEQDLEQQIQYFTGIGKSLEAKRIDERVHYDIEMIRELGHCSGIENYSRYFDGRQPGQRPYCLLDFFPDDYLLIVDESHVTIPQVRGMYGGDQARKKNLVEYGFRLPAAKDNRPLHFDEFEQLTPQTIYVSATPEDYELEKSEGIVVEQLIRPTGLLDPRIEVRPSNNQIDDLMEEIQQRIERHERVLVTTLTKRMAEELSEYLLHHDISTAYIHSEVDTLERVQIMDNLRNGKYDVLVGVNLLREGLDLPEVSLVAILDADKEGFLRSHRSLTQTIGRAARNVNGLAIMYADNITDSMQKTIDETNRRREKQMQHNQEHGITPTQIRKTRTMTDLLELRQNQTASSAPVYTLPETEALKVAEVIGDQMTQEQLRKAIDTTRRQMQEAAKKLDFITAAQLRDKMLSLMQYIND